MSIAPPTHARHTPRPDVPLRRFWWTRRLVVAYAVLAALLPVSYWLWGRAADARVRAAEAALQAAGEPITAEGLNALQKPVADNAVPDIVAASKAFHLTTAQSAWMWPRGAWSESDWQMAAGIVKDNETALAHLHEAADKPGIDWGIDYRRYTWRSLAATGPGVSYGRLRWLPYLLTTAARYHHHLGDDQSAAQDIAAIETLGRACRHPPVLIGSLVGSSIEAAAMRDWRELFRDLQPADGSAPGRRLSREQLAALIQRLTAAPYEPIGPHIPAGEWAAARSYFGPGGTVPATWRTPATVAAGLFTPLARTLLAREGFAALAEARAYAAPNFPAARARLPRLLRKDTNLAAVVVFAEGTPIDNQIRMMASAYGSIADRRMTGLALAIRLYRLDHDMAWPGRLQALVPKYVKALPADPFGNGKWSFGLVTGSLPRLYSVAENGTDDGGRISVWGAPGELPNGQLQSDYMVFLVGPEDVTTRPGD